MIINNQALPRLNSSRIYCLILCFLCGALSGCTSTINVSGHFPSPIVDPLPLTMGVVYKPAFKQYNYVENNEKRQQWQIEIGDAQQALFNTVLPAMFKEVVTLADQADEASKKTDLVFEPTLEEFQYNMPRETNVNMFEVWMKYNMKVYNKEGRLIADWILTAYGKTPTAFMKSEESALNEALIIALRDAGAGFSLRFGHVPEINSWLSQQKFANRSK
ncbi:hypothetical protein [Psychrobium sp. 1_MG-2023]|uniref:hypothetical protein n=1 Tax=Psychrobium sp. 1_MG-2023 TaxID=3062624 RepID=UPI000C3308F1|nr:hypothetical protein [Psychrobium sp. 1_MG-2023]MDP2562583.1 hypothetical protein [Psychrobium sp. 1_MG-2023]PKF59650.1 hypothetical protein CW748_00110 [Alteromonadales bacterium alter-6D02]